MDSLKFHPALLCPILLNPVDGPPLKRPYGCSKGELPKDGRPTAIFFPLRHPIPYAYNKISFARPTVQQSPASASCADVPLSLRRVFRQILSVQALHYLGFVPGAISSGF
jgi:hypothetical protein